MYIIEINKLHVSKKMKKQNCIKRAEFARVVRSKYGDKSTML